ncbi:restriction system protein [Thiohalospira halophila DSM 15071]|uniref:Restriction system protein n=2 Tax=Thiohalospira halophila TaxID=381300 RepID=A0A1I1N972_9GAMM|nr:restriction system protein [Thiohalospira halophila DSM 15071]
MVRAGQGGRQADEFVEKGHVGIGWEEVGELGAFPDKAALVERYRRAYPDWSEGRLNTAASQLIRFRDEMGPGDRVLTYDSSRRIYHIGTISGEYRHDADLLPPSEHVRAVDWQDELDRDRLSLDARNTLGSVLTLFRLSEPVRAEIEALLSGESTSPAAPDEAEEDEEALLKRYREEAVEIIKDRVSRLDAWEMQSLVAGLLRAMGYKTRESSPGPDRGIDVIASPDGFGFESPRIVVEVKHRPHTAMGAQEVRSFLGGRHGEDKGLYVSTGGFTKEARYEADRAKIPVMLMDLNGLVAALTEHYDNADSETRALVPLTRLYWPA